MFRCERWYLDTASPSWKEELAKHYTALQGYLPKNEKALSIQCDSKGVQYYHLSETAMRKKFAQLAVTGFFTQTMMGVVVIIHDIVQLLLCAIPGPLIKGHEK